MICVTCYRLLLLTCFYQTTIAIDSETVPVKPYTSVTLTSPSKGTIKKYVYKVTTDYGYVLTAKVFKDVLCSKSQSISFEDETNLFLGSYCEKATPTSAVVVSGSKMTISVMSEKGSSTDYEIRIYSMVNPLGPAPDPPVPHSKCNCGVPTINSNNRIVGGVPALLGEVPWQVLMKVLVGSTFIVHCGATLISDQYALTAAHCITSENIILVLGTIDEKDLKNKFSIESTKIHEQFSYVTEYHDIGLIKIKDKVTFTKNIIPICLPRRLQHLDFSGESMTISGWGSESEKGPTLRFLKKSSVQGQTYLACSKKEKDTIYNQLCAYRHRTDTCLGDSGGPLTYLDKSGIHYLTGIVSTGKGCAERDSYGLYTRVTGYLNWIDENTGGKICSK